MPSLAFPGLIRADALRVQQILLNLLTNAVKFTKEYGTVHFIASSEAADGSVTERFIIRDNGIGMSEAFLPHIFEPFSQENAAVSKNAHGSGLGLSIVKKLVDLMGGTIAVRSRLGEGTEYTVCLTFERAVAAAEPQAAEPWEAVLLSGKQILVCEDHPINMDLVRYLLEDKGMLVTAAANGREGVQLFAQSKLYAFDAILMDIRMPVMTGIEAAKAIRALDRPDAKDVPILAMTANAFDEDRQASKEAGMCAHLSKPVVPELLYQVLAREIRRS